MLTATAPAVTTTPPRRARSPRNCRLAAGLMCCVAALIVVCTCSLAFGSKSMPMSTVWRAFTSFDGSGNHIIIRSLREPRTLIGLLAGACLGLSGALMQGLTHNPLADPGILGINSGAALAVVLAIHFLDITSTSRFVWFAFAGAAVASVVVYGLGSVGRHAAAPVRLALAGMATAALLSSFTTSILLNDDQTLDQYRFWVVGSLSGRDMALVRTIAPFAIGAILLSLGCARPLNTLALGEDAARSLGASILRARLVCSLAIVLTTGAATAACGPIGFVGLTVAHMVRTFTGPEHRWLLPYSMVVAPLLLIGADVVGRLVDTPSEIQVGIITALLGAPAFVAIARRTRAGAGAT